jgi:hypothetical protein
MDNNTNSLMSSKDTMVGKEEISEEYNKLYNTKFIILSVMNNYIHIYHVQMEKIRCPFTTPRILVKGNESEYKLNYIPSPNLNKLYSLPVSNFIDFYQEYNDYCVYICLINDVGDIMRNKINEVILSKKTTLLNISLDDKNKYSNLALDFSARFSSTCDSNLIINGKDKFTLVGIKNRSGWKIFNIKLGTSKIKQIFLKNYDDFGRSLSLSDKINIIDKLLLDEIIRFNTVIDFDYLNSLPFFSILAYGSLYSNINMLSMKNTRDLYTILGKMLRRINQLYDLLTNTEIKHTEHYFNELGHLIFFSELLTYFYSNIRTTIVVFAKKTFYNKDIKLNDNWVLGKLLEDNNIFK